ncbi:hypothetical protein Salat_2946500 [Sesamum alatum]|uniref:Uncharacterized protein n=1 Tax=Sesamum alatum TaxID=300844 RepID=A0AAE1XK94_9LAMI|nr:hypothetical protein Salat_2946500 [Sesamum alatum]
MIGNPITCTQICIFDKSTLSRASSGSHGFDTTRFPRNDHGLWFQTRCLLASSSRRNIRVFGAIVLIWVLGGSFQALESVALMALELRGLSLKTLATMGYLFWWLGSSVGFDSSSEKSICRVLLKM